MMNPSPPSALARLLPRREEKDAFTNILALLALPLLAYLLSTFLQARTSYLDFPVLSGDAATISMEVGRGANWEEQAPLAVPLGPSAELQPVRFEFPPCQVSRLRLHIRSSAPSLALGTGEFHPALDERFGLDRRGATFAPTDFQTPPGAARPLPASTGLSRISLPPGHHEAVFSLPLAQPLELSFDWLGFVLAALLALAEYGFCAVGALLAWRRLLAGQAARTRIDGAVAAGAGLWQRTVRTVRGRPCAAIWAVAACGVVLSCYPVIFCGKSFVSPNNGTTLLYDRFPTLPGYTDDATAESQGADVLATMSCFVPYALVQRHALLADHEFPLFDRYSQCGFPLLGQGQSMIGDPLHVLMLLAGANAWAWDLKFLVSRLLFAAGVGLIVRLTTRQTAVALLLTFACCFLGFFQYRLNHPTYFCLCYAPWILYAWLHLPGASGPRAAAPWIGGLLLANWLEMNSGSVKDAYLLTLALNASGLLVLLLADAPPWRARWRVLGLTLWGQALLLLVSNPFWVTPLDFVLHSWNVYLTPRIWQLQPSLLIGFFDDIFYRQFQTAEKGFAPATNFVVFLGIAFAASHFKALVRDRVFLGLGLSALVAFATAFGIIPPAFLKTVPFVANVLHIDDVFSTILIVYVVVLAGFGLAECRRRWDGPDWLVDQAAAIGVLVFLGAVFLGVTQAAQRSTIHNLSFDQEVTKSFFFWCDAAALTAAFVALPLLLRRISRDHGRTALGLAPWVVLCLAAMLWREGQQLHFAPALDRYVSRPQVRANFYARSPAVDFLQQEMREPARVLGMQNNLFPGVSGMFGLEGLSGPDALQIPAYRRLLTAQLTFEWDWRLVSNRDTVHLCKATYDMLNVRYYLAAPGALDIVAPDVARVAARDLDVFESRDVWPRAFFTDVLSTCDGPEDFLAQVAQNDGRPFAVRADAGALPPGVANLPADQSRRVVVPATDYRLTNNTTTFQVRAPGPGVITLTEVYDGPNKQVTVNGRRTPHFQVNAAFEGIYVDRAGLYTVSVRSWPRYLTAGLYGAALGWLLLVGTGAVVYYPATSRWINLPLSPPRPVHPSSSFWRCAISSRAAPLSRSSPSSRSSA